MNKKTILRTVALAFVATMGMTSCDKSNPQMDQKANASAKAAAGDMKIAYVEVDSIMSQYKFCKEYSLILQKKGQNIQATIAQKGQQLQALQAAAANFQQKVQQNAYTREQAEGVNASLQKQNNDLQILNQRLSAEFQNETDQFNKALRDSIQHYLASYNKDKKYSIIFSKQGDNLLYADKAYDITNEIIAGLNKAYKGKATDKKDEKKK